MLLSILLKSSAGWSAISSSKKSRPSDSDSEPDACVGVPPDGGVTFLLPPSFSASLHRQILITNPCNLPANDKSSV